jgi:hypothetical protein
MQKEQQLNQLMIEYYSFDMSELKNEIERILTNEANKVSTEQDTKIKEINNNFKRIMTLAQEHIAKGSGYQVNHMDEQQTMEDFEKYGEEYEKAVTNSNQQKQSLR